MVSEPHAPKLPLPWRRRATSDAELVQQVRDGYDEPFGELYRRHHAAALRLAREVAPEANAEDVVSEAFEKLWQRLRQGRGPDSVFRAYLLQTVRTVAVDLQRRNRRLVVAPDPCAGDAELVQDDSMGEHLHEQSTLSRALAALPSRWRTYLWMSFVDGAGRGEIATVLGVNENSVSALGYRAREGLRRAYLEAHLQGAPTYRCTDVWPLLAGSVRGHLTVPQEKRVDEHVGSCDYCRAALAELRAVNDDFGAVLAPLVLGAAAAAYLGAAGHGAATATAGAGTAAGAGGLSLASGGVVGSAAAAVTAAATVAAASVAVVVMTVGAPSTPTADPPRPGAPTVVVGDASSGSGHRARGRGTAGSTSGPGAATDGTTDGPAGDPRGGPTDGPTGGPGGDPTGDPTMDPTNGPTSGPTSAPTSVPTHGPTTTGGPTALPTAVPPSTPPTGHPTTAATTSPTTTPASASVSPTATPAGRTVLAGLGQPTLSDQDVQPDSIHLTLPVTLSSGSADLTLTLRVLGLNKFRTHTDAAYAGWSCAATTPMAGANHVAVLECTLTDSEPGALPLGIDLGYAGAGSVDATLTVAAPGSDGDPDDDEVTIALPQRTSAH